MSYCRVCPAEVRWIETPHRRRVPLDPEPVDYGNYFLTDEGHARLVCGTERHLLLSTGHLLYLDHHATCPAVERVRAGELKGQESLF